MNFCDPTISDYLMRNCGTDFAGLAGLGLIHMRENPSLDSLQDPEYWEERLSEPQWKYCVVRNTRGEYEDIEVIEEEDLIGISVTGAIHSAVVEIPDLQINRDFWNGVQYKNWKICLVTAGKLMYYIDKPVTVYPKINNARSIKANAFFEVHLKWYDFSNPYILDAPYGIFFDEATVPDGIFDYTFDPSFE
jgi:hypothetical protein